MVKVKLLLGEQRTLLDLSEKREKALARKIRELEARLKQKDGEISRMILHPPKQLSETEQNWTVAKLKKDRDALRKQLERQYYDAKMQREEFERERNKLHKKVEDAQKGSNLPPQTPLQMKYTFVIPSFPIKYEKDPEAKTEAPPPAFAPPGLPPPPVFHAAPPPRKNLNAAAAAKHLMANEERKSDSDQKDYSDEIAALRKKLAFEKKEHEKFETKSHVLDTKLDTVDKSLHKTEAERDQLLRDLENEKNRRQKLQAALLMAQEAHEMETDAAAKKAAGEKAKELEAQLKGLNDERNELRLKLKIEIEKAAMKRLPPMLS